MQRLTVADFDFPLPDELIAQSPAPEREEARLLVYRPGSGILHRRFRELGDVLPPGCLFVANDTKVFPSRLRGNTLHGGDAEVFLLSLPEDDPDGSARATAIIRPRRKLLKDGCFIWRDQTGSEVGIPVKIRPLEDSDEEVSVHFSCPAGMARKAVMAAGSVPLPPYIKREGADAAKHEFDRQRYQTVYRREEGSAAAPTAGLHFSEALMASLMGQGHEFTFITLNVGLGTFAPIRVGDPADHVMHRERFRVSRAALSRIEHFRSEGRPIVFIGTTSLRSVESFYRKFPDAAARRTAADGWHETNLFLRPSQAEETIQPAVGSGLITNFHLPQSTLFMLIAALIGLENAKKAYGEAVRERYRFFSYGDASLLWI